MVDRGGKKRGAFEHDRLGWALWVALSYLPSGEKRTQKTSDELSEIVMDGVRRWVG